MAATFGHQPMVGDEFSYNEDLILLVDHMIIDLFVFNQQKALTTESAV